MTTRYDYSVYCQTESLWVHGTTRSSIKPTTCFNNNAHVIEPSATTLTGTVSPQTVVLAEEEIATNGNYKCDSVSFTAAAATMNGETLVPTVTIHDVAYPFPINLMSTSCNVGSEHKGNQIDIYFVPDSVIGGTTQIGGVNTDSIISVSGLALGNFIVGAALAVTDSQGSASLGTLVSKNSNTNELTSSGDVPRPFSNGSVITLSYPTKTGTLTDVSSGVLTVNSELAEDAIVGVNVRVAGQPVGTVLGIDGSELTISGTVEDWKSGDEVMLTLPSYSTPILDDLLPRTVLEVQESCVRYAQIGMHIKLTDGSHTEDLGRIVSIDKATKRIEVERPPTRDYSSGSYIMVTRYYIENMEFGGAGTYSFSSSRNKASYVDNGKIGRFAYTNKTLQAVRFTIKLEYLH